MLLFASSVFGHDWRKFFENEQRVEGGVRKKISAVGVEREWVIKIVFYALNGSIYVELIELN